MTGLPMVHVDAERLCEDLRQLLFERFRRAFLRREWKGSPARPSRVIEAATRHFLFEQPDTRREIQRVVGDHTTEGQKPGSRVHTVYAPELLKSLVLDIGREAWTHRHNGRVQVELKIQESEVSLHQIRPP